MKEVLRYFADDGTEFYNPKACLEYEALLQLKEEFLQTAPSLAGPCRIVAGPCRIEWDPFVEWASTNRRLLQSLLDILTNMENPSS